MYVGLIPEIFTKTLSDKTALIYITDKDKQEDKTFRTIRKVFRNILTLNYTCIVGENCEKKFGELKETIKLVDFVLNALRKGVQVIFVVDATEKRKYVSISIAYAIAKYIFELEDEKLKAYFNTPFFQINDEIIEKIKKAYIQYLKWKLESFTFTFGTSRTLAKFKEHIFNSETSKSFCGLFKLEDERYGFGEIPYYENLYDNFYEYINAPENDFYFCKTCKKSYNKKFALVYEKLKRLEGDNIKRKLVDY